MTLKKRQMSNEHTRIYVYQFDINSWAFSSLSAHTTWQGTINFIQQKKHFTGPTTRHPVRVIPFFFLILLGLWDNLGFKKVSPRFGYFLVEIWWKIWKYGGNGFWNAKVRLGIPGLIPGILCPPFQHLQNTLVEEPASMISQRRNTCCERNTTLKS